MKLRIMLVLGSTTALDYDNWDFIYVPYDTVTTDTSTYNTNMTYSLIYPNSYVIKCMIMNVYTNSATATR